MSLIDTLLLILLYLLYPYALTLCCVYGFCTAPRWRLAPVYHWKNLNEVTHEADFVGL